MILLIALFTVEMLVPVQTHVIVPFTELLARISVALVLPFDDSVIAFGKVLQFTDTGFAVSIEAGCNGVEATIVLIAAVVAFPAPWLARFGAIALGVALGLPMALLSGRIKKGQPTLMEATGMVMVCAGLALALHVSYLLACVAMGITVTNLARHHKRPFHAVEEIEWPFLALFFLFSGAYLTAEALGAAGLLLAAYLSLRIFGRVSGGWLTSFGAGDDASFSRWMGVAMLPQAGVAMAMAFQASALFPSLRDSLLPTVIAATAVFEFIGPLATRWALSRTQDIAKPTAPPV